MNPPPKCPKKGKTKPRNSVMRKPTKTPNQRLPKSSPLLYFLSSHNEDKNLVRNPVEPQYYP
jgi:hypothetical protein